MVIRGEVEAETLRLHHVEKWPVGTIAAHLHVHHDVVTRVINSEGAPPTRQQRPARIDAYLPFILDSLRRYPGLLSSRLYQMCRERGYRGSGEHFRHMVARHRPPRKVEAFLHMTALPGEHGQVDWAHFGKIKIGRAERSLLGRGREGPADPRSRWLPAEAGQRGGRRRRTLQAEMRTIRSPAPSPTRSGRLRPSMRDASMRPDCRAVVMGLSVMLGSPLLPRQVAPDSGQASRITFDGLGGRGLPKRLVGLYDLVAV